MDAYGATADRAFLATTTRRLRQYLAHLTGLAEAGSAWEVTHARRGALASMADDIAWIEDHAAELVDGPRG